MKIEYYKSQLEGCGSKEEIKPIVDETYADNELSEQDIHNIKEYAQDLYSEFQTEQAQARFEQQEAEKHGEDYLTDDEEGLTQI